MTTANLPVRRTVTAVAVPTPAVETVEKPLTRAQKDLRWVIKLVALLPTAFAVAYLLGRFFPA